MNAPSDPTRPPVATPACPPSADRRRHHAADPGRRRALHAAGEQRRRHPIVDLAVTHESEDGLVCGMLARRCRRSSREFSVLIQVGEHAELSLPLTLVFTDATAATGPPPARPPSVRGPRPRD